VLAVQVEPGDGPLSGEEQDNRKNPISNRKKLCFITSPLFWYFIIYEFVGLKEILR
jgi:hypothetical protein